MILIFRSPSIPNSLTHFRKNPLVRHSHSRKPLVASKVFALHVVLLNHTRMTTSFFELPIPSAAEEGHRTGGPFGRDRADQEGIAGSGGKIG